MYYRFQNNTEPQTSVHPYPTYDIIDLYNNKSDVEKMIKEVECGNVQWDDICSYDDIENYFFKQNYVCCNWIDEEELSETMMFDGIGCVANDEYVVLFDSEEEYKIFDGLVAKCNSFVKIYKKSGGNTYKLVK